ncbi:alpha-tocopherol transfer protein-like [Leguminivora glycinivorella]|uniref:alpha-tocopherol transfer protein-like n=1 Tax=Leguminivora glycinivorella TaxID=1035111 RepID=UPI00201007B5|nr:alpha-tocopherol transfer protein-like [Leguminivora glycinivorella]
MDQTLSWAPHIAEMAKLFQHTEEEKRQIVKNLECSEEGLKEDVEAIMEWFYKQPHLADAGIDPDVVRTFLLINKGSREKAKRRIDNFYKYRGLAPELIQSRIQALSSDQKLWTTFRYAAIPKLYQRKRITIIQLCEPNPSIFLADQVFRNLYMMNDIRVKYDCFQGDIWVVDLKDGKIGHLLRVNPMMAQRSAQIFQDGLGFKVHAIHILNFPSIGQQILSFFRKFVKAKIMDRVMIHSSVEELHEFIPKEYLPKDFGGDSWSMQEYTDICEKELRSEATKQFLLNACNHVSNEKKRPASDCNNYEYMSGTFKKLNID